MWSMNGPVLGGPAKYRHNLKRSPVYLLPTARPHRILKDDETVLDKYLDLLSSVDPGTLSQEERFAFYVNAYNAPPRKQLAENRERIQVRFLDYDWSLNGT